MCIYFFIKQFLRVLSGKGELLNRLPNVHLDVPFGDKLIQRCFCLTIVVNGIILFEGTD